MKKAIQKKKPVTKTKKAKTPIKVIKTSNKPKASKTPKSIKADKKKPKPVEKKPKKTESKPVPVKPKQTAKTAFAGDSTTRRTVVIAHAGGNFGPKNTMKNFKGAIASKCEGIEFDVSTPI